MKISTLNKYIKLFKTVKKSGLTLKQYCANNNINVQNIYNTISQIKKQHNEEEELIKQLLSLYHEVTQKTNNQAFTSEEKVDTDDRAETSYLRDDENKIKYYKYNIYRKNKSPLSGVLTREEMNTIYRLYSYYGDSLTQRVISRHFSDLSLIDFKRILRAFNITKASSPFAPHMFEECEENELREIQLREKENSFLRKAEEDQIRNNEKLLKKYAQENIELKEQLKSISNFQIKIEQNIDPIVLPEYTPIGQDINIYLSDLHLGSYTTTGSLYEENRKYGFDEAKRRLTVLLEKLREFNCFDTINIVLMGDMIDCCGFTGLTARRDHIMPNNMDAREQANKYIELMDWFVESITKNALASKINMYSVPCGNHDGEYGYMVTKALMSYINVKYPSVKTVLWEKYYGRFEQNGHVFYIMHGKDGLFMKKGMPLNLDDKSKVMLYEWLMEQGETGDNIHFIKGDLHSNSLSSCKKLDYRNVLSLYGASDYSNYNFSRNSYGVSYDLFIGDNLIRGTFENI